METREYEVAVIIQPDLADDDMAAQIELIKGWIENQNGTVENIDQPGRKRMTYEIKGQRDGYYIYFQTKLPTDAPPAIEQNLRISEPILRYMIVRTDS